MQIHALAGANDPFDLVYAAKQIPAPVQVTAVTDYTLLDELLAGK